MINSIKSVDVCHHAILDTDNWNSGSKHLACGTMKERLFSFEKFESDEHGLLAMQWSLGSPERDSGYIFLPKKLIGNDQAWDDESLTKDLDAAIKSMDVLLDVKDLFRWLVYYPEELVNAKHANVAFYDFVSESDGGIWCPKKNSSIIKKIEAHPEKTLVVAVRVDEGLNTIFPESAAAANALLTDVYESEMDPGCYDSGLHVVLLR